MRMLRAAAETPADHVLVDQHQSKELDKEDLKTLLDMSRQMTGTTICVLSDSAGAPVVSSIQKFKDEYLALIRRGERVGAA